jgi:hypothetical protein
MCTETEKLHGAIRLLAPHFGVPEIARRPGRSARRIWEGQLPMIYFLPSEKWRKIGAAAFIYFKSVLRWEPANATGFSSRTRVPRYHYLGVLVLCTSTPKAPFIE